MGVRTRRGQRDVIPLLLRSPGPGGLQLALFFFLGILLWIISEYQKYCDQDANAAQTHAHAATTTDVVRKRAEAGLPVGQQRQPERDQ